MNDENENENKSNYFNKELSNLILGRKGGKTTIKIIDRILKQPYNLNQLSNELNLDYKTIKYHMNLILKSKLVVQGEMKYGSLYYPTQKLINNLSDYEQIKKYIK